MDNIPTEEMPREIDRLLEINEKLQARIDKAVEYINTFDKGDYISSIKILDILKGSDKE